MNSKRSLFLFLILFLSLTNLSFAENGGMVSDDKSMEAKEKVKIVKEIEPILIEDVKEGQFTDKVILRGLNKITAKTYKLESDIGEAVEFERLIVKPLKCWVSPPTEKPEDKVLLKIYEKKLNNTETLIFYGWMFSSSPGLSGLEHSTYDITIEKCQQILAEEEKEEGTKADIYN